VQLPPQVCVVTSQLVPAAQAQLLPVHAGGLADTPPQPGVPSASAIKIAIAGASAIAMRGFCVMIARYRDPLEIRQRRADVIPFLILVFVDAHDVATPLPEALVRAAGEALGQKVAVSTHPLADAAPAAALVEAGRAGRATIAAQVTWLDPQRSQARLDVVSVDGTFSRTSTVAFDASDPLPERGRALGLILAALVAPEKQALVAKAQAQAQTPAASEPAAVAIASPPPAPAPAPPRRFALDAAAGGGFAIGGSGSGAGGAIGLRWQPRASVALRVGAQARFGEVGVAHATGLDLGAAAGLVLFLVPPADTRRFALALRADALLLYESLTHLSSDDPEPVRSGRFVPGAAALAEAEWALSPTLALSVGAGAEVAFGRTDIFVRQEKVADLAPLRLLAQAGLVARF
jgi:hypothetical protein